MEWLVNDRHFLTGETSDLALNQPLKHLTHNARNLPLLCEGVCACVWVWVGGCVCVCVCVWVHRIKESEQLTFLFS